MGGTREPDCADPTSNKNQTAATLGHSKAARLDDAGVDLVAEALERCDESVERTQLLRERLQPRNIFNEHVLRAVPSNEADEFP
jgi:hypothetical protein